MIKDTVQFQTTMQDRLLMNIFSQFLKIDVLLGYLSSTLLLFVSLTALQNIITFLGIMVGLVVSIIAVLRGINEYKISKLDLAIKQSEFEKKKAFDDYLKNVVTDGNTSSSDRQKEEETEKP
jgi:thiaminase